MLNIPQCSQFLPNTHIYPTIIIVNFEFVYKNFLPCQIMASFAGGEGDNSDKNDSNSSFPTTDSDNMLKTETASIVRQFVYDRFEEENEGSDSTNDEVPVLETARPDALEELRSIREENDPDSTAVRVSRRLREVGDEIQNKYQDEFQDMINQLNLTSANVYKSFADVARRLFKNGITWHRIVALLCFGFEMAKHVLRNGLAGTYMRKIYQLIVDFIVNERIAAWIAQHGGWLGFLADFRLSEPSWSTVAAVLAVGVLCVLWSMRTAQQ